MSDLKQRVAHAMWHQGVDAAIAIVLEEAAKIAKGNEPSASQYYRGRVHAAAAIRALATQP